MSGTVKHWDGPPLEAWAAWSPREAADLLAGVDVPWCVVGGWAADLFLGRETRHHEDLEIAVPRVFLPAIRAWLEQRFAMHAVGDGEVRRLAPGEPLPGDKHQCWVLDEAAGKWRMDVMSEPGDAVLWRCRRDDSVSAPRVRMVLRNADGIPYLAPEAVLLFKAKGARPKDEADFANVLPLLSADRRGWLGDALEKVHPGHPWLERLK